MRHTLFAVVALFGLFLSPVAQAQTTPAPRPVTAPSLALVVTYADGRISHELVSERATWAWTPYFPRTPATTTESGLRALRVERVRIGNDARVTVSMLSGPGLRTEQFVSAVTVSKTRP